jgi:quercetin dioxygenase-like cupin family protein
MIYNLDGEAEITISGQLYLLKKGEMIIMPARQPHAVKALKPFKMILIMVKS